MNRITGIISAEGTLQGTLSAACNLVGTITAGKYDPEMEYATDNDILELFRGGTDNGN